MELREAKPADFPAIVRLVPTPESLFLVYPKGRHPFSIDQLQALAASRHDLTVALEAERVIGFADLYDLEPGKWVFIGNVVIDQASRGLGYGRSLVSHMEYLAKVKHAVPEVRISVFNMNTPALLLYNHLGFVPYMIEQRQDLDGRHVGLIHMRKSLRDHED